ncbi:MAG: YgjV family protein [Candidatus Peribacteria bacterium]|nr:YgjV family protein [Candidatus Peribacteria bacterium]
MEISLVQFIATQSLGAACLVTIGWGLVQKDNPNRVLLSQTISNVFYALQCLCSGRPDAYSGAAIYTVSSLRNAYWTYSKDTQKIWILVVFTIVAIVSGLLTWKSAISLLPMFAAVITTYGLWQGRRNPMRMRYIIVIANIALVVYSAFNGLWVDMVGRSVMITFGVIKLMSEKKVTSND